MHRPSALRRIKRARPSRRSQSRPTCARAALSPHSIAMIAEIRSFASASLTTSPAAPRALPRGFESCEFTLALAGAGRLRLRLLADAPPGRAPPLWFDEGVLAALDMPFLTLANIKGGRSYACHECGALFERPNPLKLHLFLACGAHDAAAVWRRALPLLARRLQPAREDAAREPDAAREDAAREPDAARLEALAAAWGRARGGHVCVYCGKLYSRKYGLKIHIRTHTGYKPLRCRYCLRAFGDPSNLNKHVRLHAGAGAAAGAGAHACGVCGKRLVRRRDLERHVRARHALCAVP
ncbi:PR domain zinc finger protein 13-like [Ostrinia furnacalis]|uniref:PR domain zinc finger protein 13-like n=1 Tax=Ostrinia furnacalis TaxID=93504 RepID=UPI00103C326A|nr:PR domain zinc finger protein 13-like [Ostrinia furnacalis]